jgi:N-acetylglucosaminyldiphosphoundecaprenol N-acetyl-beta-D-mannosaminyltransferase
VTVVRTVQVLGVPLARVTLPEAVKLGLAGGLVLAPSGPGLCELERDPDYRDALLGSDLNLTDSGLLILAHALSARERLPRTSGLGYADELLRRDELKALGATFWVMPSPASMRRNLAWIRSRGYQVEDVDCYVAPVYPRTGPVEDETLLALLGERAPAHIFICIGGGIQEKLGLYLKRNLPYRPGIHCIGAAIAFLSGDQAAIPRWADRFLLGWLIRCIADPKTFVPRYLRAFRLVYLLARYGASPPPIAEARR